MSAISGRGPKVIVEYDQRGTTKTSSPPASQSERALVTTGHQGPFISNAYASFGRLISPQDGLSPT
jgi:hypothetical protein